MAKQKQQTTTHDGLLTIAVGASRKETQWKNRELLWSALVEKLSVTTRTRESYAEYRKMSKPQQDETKDIGGFVGGTLRGGRRKADSVVWRQIITLDADYIKGDIWPAVEVFFGYCCAAYSTHKHHPEAPRIRLVIPLSRPVSAEEYAAVGRRIAADIGIDAFDDTTYEPHRLMYWPSSSSDGEFVFHYLDEEWADPDEYLARYDNWKDPACWPESSRQQQVRRSLADKQGDPLQKKGVIGAFCRAYTVSAAIDAFLSDIYSEAGPGRYTYAEGSTSGGLVLYDNDTFAYSHHGTDPVSGLLVNSFDLVRIHKFGEQDDDAKDDTPPGKMPSYKAMQELALQDDAAKVELAQSRVQEVDEDFAETDDDKEWLKRLTFNQNGQIEKTIGNLELILRHDPNLQGIAHNGFKQVPVLIDAVPWRKPNDKNGPNWNDADDAALRGYLEKMYGIYMVSKTNDAFSNVTQERFFHPVRDYLESLPEWDGIERVDRLLIDYLGAEDDTLARVCVRKTLVAAIARVMQPGIKFETMLALVGPQGCGKSTLFNKLAGKWFSDNLIISDMKDKAAVEKMQGYWILESSELAGLRKAEEEMVKGFLSREKDVVRFAYDRRAAELPRQCVFVGSTNRMQGFLRDQTGNRRFWPIYVRKVPFEQSSWTLTKETIDQIWAEALQLYRDGEPLILSPKEEALAARAQKEALEYDERVPMVQEFLDTLLPLDWYSWKREDRIAFFQSNFDSEPLKKGLQRGRISAMELWCECFGRSYNEMGSGPNSWEMHSLLNQVEGWVKMDRRLVVAAYGKQNLYERVEDRLT